MKKIALVFVAAATASVLVACASSYVIPYEELEMGANAQLVLDDYMALTVADYEELQSDASDPAHYVPVADGVEPVFVGYEIVAYNEELDEDENTLYVKYFYFNGDVTESPETLAPITEAPDVTSLYYANMRSGPEDPDADEAAALTAAQAANEEFFSAEDLEGVIYGIKNYIFLYDNGDGTGVLIGQAVDGEAGYWSDRLVFAEE